MLYVSTLYHKTEGKPFTLKNFRFKLNGQSKRSSIAHSAKTTNAKTNDDDVDSTIEARGRKWETDKEKQERVAAKVSDNIMAKKEEACAKHDELKEEKKAKSFGLFMEVQMKKFELEERMF